MNPDARRPRTRGTRQPWFFRRRGQAPCGLAIWPRASMPNLGGSQISVTADGITNTNRDCRLEDEVDVVALQPRPLPTQPGPRTCPPIANALYVHHRPRPGTSRDTEWQVSLRPPIDVSAAHKAPLPVPKRCPRLHRAGTPGTAKSPLLQPISGSRRRVNSVQVRPRTLFYPTGLPAPWGFASLGAALSSWTSAMGGQLDAEGQLHRFDHLHRVRGAWRRLELPSSVATHHLQPGLGEIVSDLRPCIVIRWFPPLLAEQPG